MCARVCLLCCVLHGVRVDRWKVLATSARECNCRTHHLAKKVVGDGTNSGASLTKGRDTSEIAWLHHLAASFPIARCSNDSSRGNGLPPEHNGQDDCIPRTQEETATTVLHETDGPEMKTLNKLKEHEQAAVTT